jgi:hypothetical protein
MAINRFFLYIKCLYIYYSVYSLYFNVLKDVIQNIRKDLEKLWGKTRSTRFFFKVSVAQTRFGETNKMGTMSLNKKRI